MDASGVTWDLSSLYASPQDPALRRDLAQALERAQAFALRYRGTIHTTGGPSPQWIAGALAELESIYEQCDKPAIYAHLLHAADARAPEHGALVARTQEESSRVRAELVFFNLEWLAVEETHAQRLIVDPACARYRHYLQAARRYRSHVLSEPEEKLLEETANTGRRAFARLFDELLAAMKFAVEVDGIRWELNESGILSLLHDPRVEVRRRAAAAFSAGLEEQALPLTYIFNIVAQDHALMDRLRGYPDPMAARNLANEVDAATVGALIDACERHVDVVADYYYWKKAWLGLAVLHDYDRYAPIETRADPVPWEQARTLVLDAYGAFSPRMREVAELFFARRWIDAEVRDGKRSGAFSSATVPSAHPCVLVNYLGWPRDVLTLAHELGHGVHQYLARDRGYLQCETSLTMAETASIFGELLVFEKLRRDEVDPRARLGLLCEFVEEAFSTVFRQVCLTRFEQQLHARRRRDGELSTDGLRAIWLEVNAGMYGDSVALTEGYSWWWAYIPHFIHSPFYCYAYSFGELLVLALYESYRQQGDGFVPRYLDMLAAGGSAAPAELLSRLGVDIQDPAFWAQGLATLHAMVEEIREVASAA